MSPIPTPPAGWRDVADRAVARGRRVDRFLPFLDSRVSLAGYAWGTAVGWVWGSIWSTGRIERRDGLWIFRGMPRWAFRRGGICVGGCYLTGDDAVTGPGDVGGEREPPGGQRDPRCGAVAEQLDDLREGVGGGEGGSNPAQGDDEHGDRSLCGRSRRNR